MVHTRSKDGLSTSVNVSRDRSSSPKDRTRYSAAKEDTKKRSTVESPEIETPVKRRHSLTEPLGTSINGAERRSLRYNHHVESLSFDVGINTNGHVHETRSSSLRRKQAEACDKKGISEIAREADDETMEEEQPAPSKRRSRAQAAAVCALAEPLSERLRQRRLPKRDATAESTECSTGTPVKRSLPQSGFEDDMDMYTRVKRVRRRVKRDMYGMPLREDEGKSSEDDEVESSDEHEGEEEEEEAQAEAEDDDHNNGAGPRSYFLRQHKPRTQLFEAAPIEPRRKERSSFKSVPSRKKFSSYKTFMSPARRMHRKRTAFHGSSSTSSSSDEGSDDERRFERRKAKSMAKSRQRCLPMNFSAEDIVGTVKDRQRIGASLADIDPMCIDRSVTFDSIGGLGEHLQALKEMIVFPLLYPEVFDKFKITPPRGVLFYGPPGTGKTLVARALANECSRGEKRVAFFMRKGADCLSKWVGESERQLRLLFDQAYQMRPSIIFFDEIDGLAPVRSSRQDQIHSSIVSTLLALMDGLDSRGEVVVIGATNRIDSIDPALRRPGRFDRELLFSLPSSEARAQILKIHTKEWIPKLPDVLVEKLAEKCVGYCGADLKALCTEAALYALRRRYPQIYASEEKLQLDVTSITLSASDFERAMRRVVPAGRRSAECPGRALTMPVRPLLAKQYTISLLLLQEIFAVPADRGSSSGIGNCDSDGEGSDEIPAYRIRDGASGEAIGASATCGAVAAAGRSAFFSAFRQHPSVYRPRLLLAGHTGQGQTTHLAPALLHHYENVRTHVLDVSALYNSAVRSPEESCTSIFREARRYTPSIIYMPRIDSWWDVAGDTLRAMLLSLIEDIEPFAAVLLLATADEPYAALPYEVKQLFRGSEVDHGHHVHTSQIISLRNPDGEERKDFFKDLLLCDTMLPPPRTKKSERRQLEVLPKAPPPEPRRLTDTELRKLRQHEEATLRELRLFLRDVLNKLARDRKFQIFAKPVDEIEVPDYYEIVKKPMDLGTIMSKIDLHHYQTVADFLADIELICSNALVYNPDTDAAGRAIRHRACALRDTANALVANELDPDFESECKEIADARKKRGEQSGSSAPEYYHTRPLTSDGSISSLNVKPSASDAADTRTRYSRRLRGMEADARPVDAAAPTVESSAGESQLQHDSEGEWSVPACLSPAAADGHATTHASPVHLAKHKQPDDPSPPAAAGMLQVPSELSKNSPRHDSVDSQLLDTRVESHLQHSDTGDSSLSGPAASSPLDGSSIAPGCNGYSENRAQFIEAAPESSMPRLLSFDAEVGEQPSESTPLPKSSTDAVDVSVPHLSAILDDLVERTYGFDVSRLEYVYASLSRKVCQYRNSVNRKHMSGELELLVRSLTT